jgi:hypothetical protein
MTAALIRWTADFLAFPFNIYGAVKGKMQNFRSGKVSTCNGASVGGALFAEPTISTLSGR